MAKNVLKIAAAFVISAVVWYGLIWFLYNDSQSALASLVSVFGIDPFSSMAAAVAFMALPSALLFATLVQLFLNRLWMPFFTAEAVLYVLALLVVVFGKSQGIQEWNINPADIFSQVVQYPSSVLLNIALFVPMGLLAHCRIKETSKAMLVALVAILAIEVLQYIFALGIADIVDVILNMMGFAIGYLSTQLVYDQGARLAPIEDTRLHRLVRRMPSHHDGSSRLSRRSTIALAVLICVACFGFVLVYTFYDYDSYVEWDDTPQATEDEVFSALPLEDEASIDVDQARESVAVFSFGDATSTNGWLSTTEDGFLCAKGVVSETYSWLTEDGEACYAVTLATEEAVGDVSVAHALPLVITQDSQILLDGEAIDVRDESALEDAADLISLCTVDATFSLQDGWLRIEEAEFDSAVDAPTPDAGISYATYSEELAATRAEGDRGVDFKNNEPTELEAYIDAYSEMEDGDSFITVRVNDLLGSALISHSFSVACDEQPATFGDDMEPSAITVMLDSDGLRLVE